MTTKVSTLESSMQKTNLLLGNIEKDLGWEGHRHQSYEALRAVLQALRDRLPLDETINFAAQLPLVIKGVFFDGWQPQDVPIKMTRDEFVERISKDLNFLKIEDGTGRIIKAVLDNLFQIINPDEANKLLDILPSDISSLLRIEL